MPLGSRKGDIRESGAMSDFDVKQVCKYRLQTQAPKSSNRRSAKKQQFHEFSNAVIGYNIVNLYNFGKYSVFVRKPAWLARNWVRFVKSSLYHLVFSPQYFVRHAGIGFVLRIWVVGEVCLFGIAFGDAV